MKVIVCVDETQSSLLALENAVEFATDKEFEVVLVHSMKRDINPVDLIEESYDTALGKSKQLMSRLKDKIKEMNKDIDIDSVILDEESKTDVQSITDYIKDQDNIYQVFIGHRAVHKKHEEFYGSFAKDMISKSPVPVVVTTENKLTQKN